MRKKEIEREKIDPRYGWTEQRHFFDNSARFMPDRTEEAVAHGADKKDEFSLSLSLDAAGGGGGGASKGCEQRERGGGGEEYRCVAEEEGGREGGRSGGSAEAHRGWDKRGYRSYRRFYVTNQS